MCRSSRYGALTLIRTIIYDKYSGSTKITTHLDHISHRKMTSGINWSNRWTCRAFIINTRRDSILTSEPDPAWEHPNQVTSPSVQGLPMPNLIRTSIYDKYSGSMKIPAHLDHTSNCRTSSRTTWSNRWTCRVFIIDTPIRSAEEADGVEGGEEHLVM